jgi:small-conductance mechanosensitive channel
MRLIAEVADYRQKLDVETALREEIYKSFMHEGIQIPYPHHVVQLTQPDAIQVTQKK